MTKLLHIVADYGVGDPAFAEVMQRLASLYPDFHFVRTSVPSFNTVATGFWISQFALGTHPEGMMIFSNTAPRKDDLNNRQTNAGEQFQYVKLQNGVEIAAVNSGYCFSFIKPYISEFKVLNTQNEGSQFRSRDFYPQAAASVAQADQSVFGRDLDKTLIPEIPANSIAWVDGYGNIKTTIRKSQVSFEVGSQVSVTINGVTRKALVSGASFSVKDGELAFSRGSSGYEDSFMEIFLRGGNAYEYFGKPDWNQKLIIDNAL